MKTKLLLLLICFSVSSLTIAQQDDMAEHYTKIGYVEKIDYDLKLVSVNYIVKDTLESELIKIDEAIFLNEKKKPITINDIKFSDQVKIVGDKFPERKYNIAKEITLLNPKIDESFKGRVDYIKNDLAVIDGIKVKLKSGKKIKGKPKSPYEGSYDAFTDLKYGILAEVNGDIVDGYIAADKVTVDKPLDDKYEVQATAIQKELYDKFYPIWTDKAKRSTLFNTQIENVGRILNDGQVQDYVNNVAQKLIPDYVKKKINFIFIVVENPEPNANVRANGLAFVNTGLLKILENEAQLATVLGHEIAHVLYKHNSNEMQANQEAEKSKNNVNKTDNAITNTLNKIKSKVSKNDKNLMGLDENKEKKMTKADQLNNSDEVKLLKINYIDKRTSNYSIEQELQADRVGLALMALAGYDPREAPIVWKNMISNYDVDGIEKNGVSLLDALEKDITADPKEKEKEKEKQKTKEAATSKNKNSSSKPAGANKNNAVSKETEDENDVEEEDKSILESTASFVVKWKSDDFKAKSYQSHPDQIKRFEELNRIISAYWNNAELYKENQIVVNDKKYQLIKKRLVKKTKK